MPVDNLFLAAVLAAPADDTVRLVYADWLDEHDDADRAEFIRTQIELANGFPDLSRRYHLEGRQRDLLIAHEAEWTRPLAEALGCRPGAWGGWVFRRGFAEYFRLTARTALRHGGRLAELTPVRELLLDRVTPGQVITLSKKPWVGSVRALYLDGLRLTESAAWALLDSPYLTSLDVLEASVRDLPADILPAFRARFGSALRK